jgi:hypothetical protein
MGSKKYGVLSGVSGNGQVFYTPQGAQTSTNTISSLQAIQVAALALEAAVSAALIGSGTAGAAPVAAAGWMSGSKLATLSASYSSVTGSIY